jgi:hypothetical protein
VIGRRSILGLAAGIVLAAALLTAPPGASAVSAPAYEIHKVGEYGGEPSIWADGRGILWSTYLNGDPNIYRSTDHGTTWVPVTTADSSTGDDCVVTDQTNDGIYWCNLAGSQALHPLEGDVWKSVDGGQSWTYGEGNVSNLGGLNALGTSSNIFGVDRQWVDTYIAPGGTTETGTAYFFYHDFSLQSNVYVNVSHDGGATWAAPINLMTSFDPAAPDTVAVETASVCNTIPTAVRTAKSGPHAGRVYAAWIAADATSLATGCDFSQFQAFHSLIVAWSDNDGVTWTPKIAYDGGFFHDASSPFASFTLDDQGNPYYAFDMNQDWDQTCAVPANPQTPNCQYDMFVTWSPDGGDNWSGPFKVNTDSGTHWFPAISAAQPGQVDVAWLRTPYVIATDANGKQHPGGCFPLECGSEVEWNLFAAQSVDLTAATPTWTTTPITSAPMHTGDICNLGIACPPGASNRNLADFISMALDEKGCAHINFADDETQNQVSSADQIGGYCLPRTVAVVDPGPTAAPSPSPSPGGGPLPNTSLGSSHGTPLTLALLGAGLVLAGMAVRPRRRRRGPAGR